MISNHARACFASYRGSMTTTTSLADRRLIQTAFKKSTRAPIQTTTSSPKEFNPIVFLHVFLYIIHLRVFLELSFNNNAFRVDSIHPRPNRALQPLARRSPAFFSTLFTLDSRSNDARARRSIRRSRPRALARATRRSFARLRVRSLPPKSRASRAAFPVAFARRSAT